jgi:hypothetical protein
VANFNDRTSLSKKLISMLASEDITSDDKLKIVLIFNLKFEGDKLCYQLNELLRNRGI